MYENGRTGVRCSHNDCRALNPPMARYCGRCGRPLWPEAPALIQTLFTFMAFILALIAVTLFWVGGIGPCRAGHAMCALGR